ncbi:hypothetical protein [Polyangium aurulentum]|uniref:hypothetical protein n=1 Tax=Polyangium aurulentum TaxID=2567896 RepID=UPI0010AEC7ED|nr:hypothetical protein [Polyangium aurulentum]UQA54722.1 hypothetical protein E8A73_025455 [Polyangium aurulentum]
MRPAALLGLALFLPACDSCSPGAPANGKAAAPSAAPTVAAAPRSPATQITPIAPAAKDAPPPPSSAAPAASAAETAPAPAEDPASLRCRGALAKAGAELRNWPSRTLDTLRRDSGARGGVDTEGVVTDTVLPEPCPEGAQCKPSPPPYAVFSLLDAPKETFIGVTPSADELTIGERVKFSVILCGTWTYGGSINYGEIVAISR